MSKNGQGAIIPAQGSDSRTMNCVFMIICCKYMRFNNYVQGLMNKLVNLYVKKQYCHGTGN